MAAGFWFNHGGETSVSLAIGEDGTATVSIGTPDIGGSRASIALMTAETLGIGYDDVRVNVVETGALGRERADAWQPRHLCQRHGGGRGGKAGDQDDVRAGGGGMGH